jgi:hypothetical protein
MKTAILYALIFGCIIPTYSQINRHRKTDTSTEQFSGKQNKKNNDFGDYKFDDKFNDSWNDRSLDNFTMPRAGRMPGKISEEIYSGDNMPCVKPEGTFSMKAYKPDSTVEYTMLVKKFRKPAVYQSNRRRYQ